MQPTTLKALQGDVITIMGGVMVGALRKSAMTIEKMGLPFLVEASS